ncbi:MAG: hypothetical protein H6707_10600 [Deltaproteobacteria bacterium]|nr:hypothetical protein [Deltaproteobacteria bacterium]
MNSFDEDVTPTTTSSRFDQIDTQTEINEVLGQTASMLDLDDGLRTQQFDRTGTDDEHTPLSISVEGFRARYPVAPIYWLANDATAKLANDLRAELPDQATLITLADCDLRELEGPAVLVLTHADMFDEHQEASLHQASRRARPGRPVIFGGIRHKEALLAAINTWDAIRVIDPSEPIAAVVDALSKAHDALHVEYAFDSALTEFRAQRMRQRFALNKLRQQQEQILGRERLAAIGRVTGALSGLIDKCLAEMDSIVSITDSDPELSQIAQSAVDGFATTRAFLREVHDHAATNAEDIQLRPQPLAPLLRAAARMISFDNDFGHREVHIAVADNIEIATDRHAFLQALMGIFRSTISHTPDDGRISIEGSSTGTRANIGIRFGDASAASANTLEIPLTALFAADDILESNLQVSRLLIRRCRGALSVLPGEVHISLPTV